MDYDNEEDHDDIMKYIFKDIDQPRQKKRRTSEKVKIDKQKLEDDEMKYANEVFNEQYNLDCLWSKAYMLYYNMDSIRNCHPYRFIDFINKLKQKESVEDFHVLIDSLKKGPKEVACYLEKYNIYEYLQNNSNDIRDIVESIKNQDEASIVMDAMIGTEHITLLDKGYSASKKLKQNKKTRLKKISTYLTYEQALRKNRHLLETYLKEIGVGQQRSQKISQILAFL